MWYFSGNRPFFCCLRRYKLVVTRKVTREIPVADNKDFTGLKLRLTFPLNFWELVLSPLIDLQSPPPSTTRQPANVIRLVQSGDLRSRKACAQTSLCLPKAAWSRFTKRRAFHLWRAWTFLGSQIYEGISGRAVTQLLWFTRCARKSDAIIAPWDLRPKNCSIL